MPTLNASSSDLRDRLAAEQEDDQPLLRAGAARRRREQRRERVDDLREQRVVDRRVHAERLAGRSRASAIRKHPRDRLRQRSRRRTKPRRGREDREARRDAGANSSRRLARRRRSAITTAASERRRARSRVRSLVLEEEPPVDGREPRVDLVRRQHADRERPDDQRAARRRSRRASRRASVGVERRVRRARDAVLDRGRA